MPEDFCRNFMPVNVRSLVEYLGCGAAFHCKKDYLDRVHTHFESDKSAQFIKKSRFLMNINLRMHPSNIFKNTLFLFKPPEFLLYIHILVYPARHFAQL